MRTGKHQLVPLLVVVSAALAAAVPVAQATGPDDRPFYRGSSSLLSPVRSTPDDRAYYRGTSAALAPKSLSPDDRAYSRSTPAIDVRTPTTPIVVADATNGFNWTDALIGGAFGLAVASLGAGAVLIAVRHRRSVRTA